LCVLLAKKDVVLLKELFGDHYPVINNKIFESQNYLERLDMLMQNQCLLLQFSELTELEFEKWFCRMYAAISISDILDPKFLVYYVNNHYEAKKIFVLSNWKS